MRVSTFNTLNLNAPGLGFIGRSNAGPFTNKRYEQKLEELAKVLTKTEADIVGFQEVFSEVALKDLVSRSHLNGAYVDAKLAQVETSISGEKVGLGPHVGIASKFPFLSAPAYIRDFPPEMHLLVPTGLHGTAGEIHHIGIRHFERPVLRAELDVPGLEGLVVFVAHLKSKRPKFLEGEVEYDGVVRALGAIRSLIVRAAEAAALRSLIISARNEWVNGRRRPVIVLGDLNDDLDAVTTEMLVGKRPYSRDGSISRRSYHYDTRDLMLSAFELSKIPAQDAWTHVYDGKGSILDMVLLSADFWGKGGEQRAEVVSTKILNDFLKPPTPVFEIPTPKPYTIPEEPEPPKDWLIDPEPSGGKRTPKLGLDHGIPVVEIAIPKQKEHGPAT